MAKTLSYKTLVWLIVILVATNLSMGISFLYHKKQDLKTMKQPEKDSIVVPSEQRTKFFKEQLNLSSDQVDKFRELNRNYNRTARDITYELESLRAKMVEELGKNDAETEQLSAITKSIGELHTKLKDVTIEYYLGMKKICNEPQKAKLNEVFKSMLKQNEDIRLPGRQGRYRRGYGNSH